jgi:hypothetical protein
MNKLRRLTARVGGITLILLGLLHVVFGLPVLERAVQRGDLAQRLAASQMVNWAFSGAATSLLGVLVLLAAWDLGVEGRLANRILAATGLFFTILGVAAYAWQPTPAVLVFSVVGLMLWVPMMMSRGR